MAYAAAQTHRVRVAPCGAFSTRDGAGALCVSGPRCHGLLRRALHDEEQNLAARTSRGFAAWNGFGSSASMLRTLGSPPALGCFGTNCRSGANRLDARAVAECNIAGGVNLRLNNVSAPPSFAPPLSLLCTLLI